MGDMDKELIEKAKGGDKQAFAELFDSYKDRIFGYIYRYVGDYQSAQDLTVETFLNAYNNLSKYEERGIFSSWLYRIATNCAKKELRRRNQRKEVSLEEPVADESDNLNLGGIAADENTRPDNEASRKELKYYIYKVVRRLDKKYKDVLLLCVVEGMEYEEAAKILKCNPVTVGTRLRRARKILYDILKKHGFQF